MNRRTTDGTADGALRRICLCADDYGISGGVNTAIRALIARGRINATSVMTVAPRFQHVEAAALARISADSGGAAIGLHLTLTAPFRPLSSGYRPRKDDAFLPLGTTLLRSLLHTLDRQALLSEVATQLDAFVEAFGRAPDFVDGHQHVQLFPQVRDAVLALVQEAAPNAWVRQCGRNVPLGRGLANRKALLLDLLSHGMRRRAAAAGVPTNLAFAGAYDFAPQADFARLFAGFLDGLPDGGVIMCHPGHVDDALRRLDPLGHLREREYAFLAGDAFPPLLAAHGVTLA